MSIVTFEPNEFGLSELEDMLLNDARVFHSLDRDSEVHAYFVEGDSKYIFNGVTQITDKESGESVVYVRGARSWETSPKGNKVPVKDNLAVIRAKDLSDYTWDDENAILEHKT